MTGSPKKFHLLTSTSVLLFCLLPILFFLEGCATKTFAPEVAPEYVVIRNASAFYRLGPQQAHGPDTSLRNGTQVKLLRREMGFSLVQLEDLRTGYLANENMAVAPPQSAAQPAPEAEAAAAKKKGKRDREEESPVYSGPPTNDTPLPSPNVPPPDLNVEPEIVPDTDAMAVPEATPDAKPKFRY